ncbi:helix-turn-helix transcriptional regulator [Methylobacterium sp. E-045]|uniref:helix-turn-helix transcriptional regulator n=1 Tax=Methylobacterium sp. E-045 TaxID=2836575 RepID=UPI001FB8C5BB|nr:LuxR family transcriptional regulator [Methylobacterium sp. E-045]MCJ2129087.1 LuxR family transcriptional regulator [Methylobacterium sp. E-045]
MSEFDLGLIIDGCYAAALDQRLWPDALAAVSRASGARGSVIVSLNPLRTPSPIASDGLAEANADYQARWWQFDTRVAKARSFGLRPGHVLFDRHFLTPDEKRGDPFFEDFSVRHRLGELAAFAAVDPIDGCTFTLSMFRDARSDLYSEREVKRIEVLAPHVVRAVGLAAALGQAHRHSEELERGLERMRFGAILLDGQGCVRHVSHLAERLMEGRLRLDADRRTRTVVCCEQARLDDLIAAALKPASRNDGASLLLHSAGGRRPVFIEAVPLPIDVARAAPNGGVLLMLRDLFAPTSETICPQLEQLGLSPAEARVAMLVGRGHAPRQVAKMLGITEGTARVHLRACFSKLDLVRQSELAILVTRLDDCARF